MKCNNIEKYIPLFIDDKLTGIRMKEFIEHKEKCKVLKGVRKQIADKLGIDLHQTECTYEFGIKQCCSR